MNPETEAEWQKILKELKEEFGQELDLQGVLFLVGVQELGKGYKPFSKQEKTELLHIAVCALLEKYGYYEFAGRDEGGWPHWKSTDKLPALKPLEQERLIKQALVLYFQEKQDI